MPRAEKLAITTAALSSARLALLQPSETCYYSNRACSVIFAVEQSRTAGVGPLIMIMHTAPETSTVASVYGASCASPATPDLGNFVMIRSCFIGLLNI